MGAFDLLDDAVRSEQTEKAGDLVGVLLWESVHGAEECGICRLALARPTGWSCVVRGSRRLSSTGGVRQTRWASGSVRSAGPEIGMVDKDYHCDHMAPGRE